ncbi:MAG TPA: RNA 3'-terminal phosphate cyclase [Steroidobacter sp.]|uniref:RNA 3'-terminal phosphate cyclase n=1 Tax=Steroidobacter sp. TaxID=1978227 RepID=UPI002EDB2948
MIEIDGSQGEGGGQILRSSLSLAICTQQPFRIVNIRANRDKPGLLRQHLTAVKAAAEICDAVVVGDEIGSRELTFKPGRLKGGSYSFAIGTAGSSTLVLQTVLPPLLTAAEESVVRITGGTHNRGSPPFDFLQRAFLPLVARMGARVELELRRYGFYPRGGGEIVARITPSALSELTLTERGEQVGAYAEAYVAALPIHIGQRELEVIGKRLHWSQDQLFIRGLSNDMGPGNAVTITVEHANVTEVFTGFGERGVRSEDVASGAVDEARGYLGSEAAVGEHLADQLLLPMALGQGGSFTTSVVTEHLRSNATIIETFMPKRVLVSESGGAFVVRVS